MLVAVHRGSTTAVAIARELRLSPDELKPLVLAMLAAGVITKVKAGVSLGAAVSVEEAPDVVKVVLDGGEGCSIGLSVPRLLLEI